MNGNNNAPAKVSSLQSFLRKLHLHGHSNNQAANNVVASNDIPLNNIVKEVPDKIIGLEQLPQQQQQQQQQMQPQQPVKTVLLPVDAPCTPRRNLRRNLKALQQECQRTRRSTDQRTLQLIATMFNRRLADAKVGVYLVDVIQQARSEHAPIVARLEKDLETMSQARPIRVSARVAHRPRRILIPMVRVHNERLQEIELLVNVTHRRA
jgi:hypothetical protein